MACNEHKTEKGLREIIELSYSMNPSGTRRTPKEELLKLIGS
jgi:hypothetical protein